MNATANNGRKRAAAFLLCLVLAAAFLAPAAVRAESDGKTVRVGWYESSFNTRDRSGRRSGYAYEYQLKLSAYTGWSYEYVNGSWSELLEKLEAGEIDLLSDVSYTPERDGRMLFPSAPMGTEEYYLFIAPGNRDITPTDPASLNGKRVGVNKGSVQTGFYLDWAERNGVTAELIEVTGTEDNSLFMLERGELDAYVTVDSFTNPQRAVPVFKIDSSDFFFAVNAARPDLLAELNNAMERILDENRYYNILMFEKHFNRTGANAFLTLEEQAWLSAHGTIRVGYQDNYMAFCAADEFTGELKGVLGDYLSYAADCMANAHLDFEAVAYPTVSAAMEALERGEVDCVFPASISSCDGEELGVAMTPPLLKTEVYAAVPLTNQNIFDRREHVIVAVNEGNLNYDAFLSEHFPRWRKVYYPTTEDCLKSVADNVADCVLISNYRFNNLSRLCDKYHITAYTTGVEIDYSLATRYGEAELYSILAKTVGIIPDTTMSAALFNYIAENTKFTFSDFVADHLRLVMTVVAAVLLVIVALLLANMKAVRRANRLISATETDDLTGLYNRKFFFQYAERMYRDHPDTPMDAIVLNIERFHSVNALNGRDFGDQVLRALGDELRALAEETEGIAGRFEADRFDIYCRHLDDYPALFSRLQNRLDELAPNISICLRMGVMPWQKDVEPVQMFDRARTACSMARGNYKEHLVVFDDKVRKRELYEQRLLNDLRRALDEYEFDVYYQPKFDIQTEPPQLVSAEALVRWRHPELGMIPPDDFISLFERNGQISAVDRYVWEGAAKQIGRWREKYGVTLPVSVNLSRVDVFDPALEKTLDSILAFNGLDCNTLKLEVTESAYTENADQVIQVVENLRRKGFQVEMDDFGSGYSSLNMLSAMPVDVLKMDRAFIQNIEHDEKDIQLVALILDIAKNLRVPVVAEGVETEEQMKLLKELGCELVQGYYFSRPLHAEEFEKLFIQNMRSAR